MLLALSRATRVAKCTPPLAGVLSRAFTTTSPTLAASGKRTEQRYSKPKPGAYTSDAVREQQRKQQQKGPRKPVHLSERRLASLNERANPKAFSDGNGNNSKPLRNPVRPGSGRPETMQVPDIPSAGKKASDAVKLPLQRNAEVIAMSRAIEFGEIDNLRPQLAEALLAKFPRGRTTPIQSLAWANTAGGDLLELRMPVKKGDEEAVAEGTSKKELGRMGPHRAILGAETGSGKTHAYLVPMLQGLKASEEMREKAGEVDTTAPSSDVGIRPRALVLQPTHELARQSTAMAKELTHTTKLSVCGASTVDYSKVRRYGDVDVLFATATAAHGFVGLDQAMDAETIAGEITEDAADGDDGHRAKRRNNAAEDIMDLSALEWLVLDETDVLLGGTFSAQIAAVFARVLEQAPNVNILLVTATLSPALLETIQSNKLLGRGKFRHILSPGLHQLPALIETRFIPWNKGGNALAEVANEIKRGFAEDAIEARRQHSGWRAAELATLGPSKAVVFVGTAKKAERLLEAFKMRDIPSLLWTADASSAFKGPKSKSPIRPFLVNHGAREDDVPEPPKADDARVLITTSMLSRGLDFSHAVSTIYLVDPPRTVLDFMHRAGRTGRGGYHGRVVMFGVRNTGQIHYGDALKGVLRKVSTQVNAVPGARPSVAKLRAKAREEGYSVGISGRDAGARGGVGKKPEGSGRAGGQRSGGYSGGGQRSGGYSGGGQRSGGYSGGQRSGGYGGGGQRSGGNGGSSGGGYRGASGGGTSSRR